MGTKIMGEINEVIFEPMTKNLQDTKRIRLRSYAKVTGGFAHPKVPLEVVLWEQVSGGDPGFTKLLKHFEETAKSSDPEKVRNSLFSRTIEVVIQD